MDIKAILKLGHEFNSASSICGLRPMYGHAVIDSGRGESYTWWDNSPTKKAHLRFRNYTSVVGRKHQIPSPEANHESSH